MKNLHLALHITNELYRVVEIRTAIDLSCYFQMTAADKLVLMGEFTVHDSRIERSKPMKTQN